MNIYKYLGSTLNVFYLLCQLAHFIHLWARWVISGGDHWCYLYHIKHIKYLYLCSLKKVLIRDGVPLISTHHSIGIRYRNTLVGYCE